MSGLMKPGLMTYLRYSFAFRLVAIYLGIFMASFSILVALAYWIIVSRPLEDAKRLVTDEMQELSALYKGANIELLRLRLEVRAEEQTAPRAFHALITSDGTVITTNLPSWPSRPRPGPYRIDADSAREGGEIAYRALSMDKVFPDGARLLVGRDIEDIVVREEWLFEAFAWSAGISFFLGTIGGVFMSLAVGKRLEAVNYAARQVIAGDLSGRIERSGTEDDFDKLAVTLNLMLSKIESSVQALSRVSDSIAHELRMPLARLHADLEDLAAAIQHGEADQDLIVQAMTEAGRMKAVFEALLRIARIETGRHAIERQRVDLVPLLEDAVELYLPEAEGRQQVLQSAMPEGLTVSGDPDLLFQAFSNLIDNAIKFSPRESVILVTAELDRSGVLVRIENEGDGIPPEHRAKVTERFYRLDEAQDRPGIGLGLSLVDVVVSAHDGHLAFKDTEIGFAVEVMLPKQAMKPGISGKTE